MFSFSTTHTDKKFCDRYQLFALPCPWPIMLIRFKVSSLSLCYSFFVLFCIATLMVDIAKLLWIPKVRQIFYSRRGLWWLWCYQGRTNWRNCILTTKNLDYRGVPTTYEAFTTANPTTTIFGLCTHKWGIFTLVGDPIKSH